MFSLTIKTVTKRRRKLACNQREKLSYPGIRKKLKGNIKKDSKIYRPILNDYRHAHNTRTKERATKETTAQSNGTLEEKKESDEGKKKKKEWS